MHPRIGNPCIFQFSKPQGGTIQSHLKYNLDIAEFYYVLNFTKHYTGGPILPITEGAGCNSGLNSATGTDTNRLESTMR